MQLIAGGLFIVAAALVTVVIVGSKTTEPRHIEADPRPVCIPDDTWLKPGWPTWTVCADSNGYHTCWRPADHGGRHCEWDLSNGKVTAVWPCTQRRAITSRKHAA